MNSQNEINGCPLCNALPCDWVDDPFKEEYALLKVLADIRSKSGIGSKPMLTELADAVAAKIDQYPRIIDIVRQSELRLQNECLEKIQANKHSMTVRDMSELNVRAGNHGHALAVLRSIEHGVAIESIPLPNQPNEVK